MKYYLLMVGALLAIRPSRAQTHSTDSADIRLAARYLAEIGAAGRAEGGRLWGVPLAGPVLLVKPATRAVFASEADSADTFRAVGTLFTGFWPTNQPLANTAVTWQGKRWTMLLLWPMPPDALARQNLVFHARTT